MTYMAKIQNPNPPRPSRDIAPSVLLVISLALLVTGIGLGVYFIWGATPALVAVGVMLFGVVPLGILAALAGQALSYSDWDGIGLGVFAMGVLGLGAIGCFIGAGFVDGEGGVGLAFAGIMALGLAACVTAWMEDD